MPDWCCFCCNGEDRFGSHLFGNQRDRAAAGQRRVDGVGRPKFDFHTGSHYDDTKKNVKDANARANALAALIFIQFVISLAQVWVASTRLRLAKKADEPTKAETEGSFEGEVASKEPSAEEPASEKSSGCVAS